MVSIIIPAYNAEKTIGRAINSVKVQTYTDWECFIVDDCSTDKTAECVALLTDDDERFAMINFEKNHGVSMARNCGIHYANGDAIFFLDADDWMEPWCLEYLVSKSEYGRVFSPPIIEWTNGKENKWNVTPTGFHCWDSPFPFATYACDIGHVTGSLYNKKGIKPDCLIFQDVPIYEDMLFNIGVLFSGCGVFITDKSPYHYCRRGGSITYGGLSVDGARKIFHSFEELAVKYNPKREPYLRCKRFLTNTIRMKIGDKFNEI